MKIRQTTIISHPLDTDKTHIKSEIFFDNLGNKIEYKEFKSGKISVWEKYNYDSDNRIIELIKYSGDSYKIEDYKPIVTKYQYENACKLVADEKWVKEINTEGMTILSAFHSNGTIKYKKYINAQGHCFEENHFAKSSLTKRILSDDVGNILEERNFRSDGLALNYTINTYNAKKQLCRRQCTSRTGNLSENRILKYNSDGLLVEDIDHALDPDNAFADIIDSSNGYNRKYVYNSDKLIETENLYLCGELIMVYRYSYLYW